MNYRPNVDAVCWFVQSCWPLIRKSCPDALFRIIGRWPSRAVCALAAAPGVEVIGAVDDVNAELYRLDVSVAPMRIARGLQNKVLEAMAAARPVVLTTPPAAALGAVDGRTCLVADSPSDIAVAVVRLLHDSHLRERLGRAARHFVATHYRWRDALDRLEWIVTGVVQRHAARSKLEQIPTISAPIDENLYADV